MTKDLNKLFGIDKETLEKSKDIKPILDLGAMKDNSIVRVEFSEKEPREVETPNSKYSKTARVISVKDITEGEQNSLEYSLFLSAKTLSLGVAKIWEKHNFDLTGVKAVIKKTKAVFKEFGENTAYNIQEVE